MDCRLNEKFDRCLQLSSVPQTDSTGFVVTKDDRLHTEAIEIASSDLNSQSGNYPSEETFESQSQGVRPLDLNDDAGDEPPAVANDSTAPSIEEALQSLLPLFNEQTARC